MSRHKRGPDDDDIREDVSTFIRELNKDQGRDEDDSDGPDPSGTIRKRGRKPHGEKHLPGANLGKIGVAKSRRKRIKMIMTRRKRKSSISGEPDSDNVLRNVADSKKVDDSGVKRDAIVPEYEFDDNHDNLLSNMLGGR